MGLSRTFLPFCFFIQNLLALTKKGNKSFQNLQELIKTKITISSSSHLIPDLISFILFLGS